MCLKRVQFLAWRANLPALLLVFCFSANAAGATPRSNHAWIVECSSLLGHPAGSASDTLSLIAEIRNAMDRCLPPSIAEVYAEAFKLVLSGVESRDGEALDRLDVSALLPSVVWMREQTQKYQETLQSICARERNAPTPEVRDVWGEHKKTYFKFLKLMDEKIASGKLNYAELVWITDRYWDQSLVSWDARSDFPLHLYLPRVGPFSVREINDAGPFGVHWLELTHGGSPGYDGNEPDPKGSLNYFDHDIAHARSNISRNQIERTAVMTPSEYIRALLQNQVFRVRLYSAFREFQRTQIGIQNELLELIWFTLDHEERRIYRLDLPGRSDLISRLERSIQRPFDLGVNLSDPASASGERIKAAVDAFYEFIAANPYSPTK